MRRLVPPILLLALLLLLGWMGRLDVGHQDTDPSFSRSEGATPPDITVQPVPPETEGEILAEPNPTAGSPFYSKARAYRIVMSELGACSLEAVEELKGDFRKPRSMKRLAGMFSCRLLDTNGRVLAESTIQAPDQVCVVLDPQVTDAAGAPLPSRLTSEGPVVFQVRLPKVEDAAALEIVRLAGSREPQGDERPLGQLVALLDLTR